MVAAPHHPSSRPSLGSEVAPHPAQRFICGPWVMLDGDISLWKKDESMNFDLNSLVELQQLWELERGELQKSNHGDPLIRQC